MAKCSFTGSPTAQSRWARWSTRVLAKMSKVTKVIHWASVKPQSRLPSEATWIEGLRIFKCKGSHLYRTEKPRLHRLTR